MRRTKTKVAFQTWGKIQGNMRLGMAISPRGYGSAVGALLGAALALVAWVLFSEGVALAALMPLGLVFALTRGAALSYVLTYYMAAVLPATAHEGAQWLAGGSYLVLLRPILLAMGAYAWTWTVTPSSRVGVLPKVLMGWFLTLLTPIGDFGYAHPAWGWGFIGDGFMEKATFVVAPIITALLMWVLTTARDGRKLAGTPGAWPLVGVPVLLTVVFGVVQTGRPPTLAGGLLGVQAQLGGESRDTATALAQVLALLQSLEEAPDFRGNPVRVLAGPIGTVTRSDAMAPGAQRLQQAVDKMGTTLVLGVVEQPQAPEQSLVLRPGGEGAIACSRDRGSFMQGDLWGCGVQDLLSVDMGSGKPPYRVILMYAREMQEPSMAAVRAMGAGAQGGVMVGGSSNWVHRYAYRVNLKHYLSVMRQMGVPAVVAQVDQII